METIPVWQVPRLAAGRAAAPVPWDALPALPPFVLADASATAAQATAVRLAWSESHLHVRFDCADDDAWGTLTRRDDPLYTEECVEIFLAPGAADPATYLELEVSPLGTLFDARIDNPDSRRDTMRADLAWDCPGLAWAAGRTGRGEDWWAELAIPFAALVNAPPISPAVHAPGGVAPPRNSGPGVPPRVWRANFYRIERPRGGTPEFSCWSPTLTSPPDFHQPARFGRLELSEELAIA